MRGRDDNQVTSAQATLARDIEREWRNWKAYIAEKRDELAAQQEGDTPEADLTGSGRPQARKAKLDAATRQRFGSILESRRRMAQETAEKEAREAGVSAPDADTVYAALLDRFAAELDGRVHPDGYALLYYKDNRQPMVFNAAAIGAGTTDADYLAAGSGAGPTKVQAFIALGAVVALGIAAFFMIQWAFAAPETSVAAASGVAQVGQTSAPLWTVDAAQIGPRAVPATTRGTYPLVLCVDDAAAKAATPETTVVLTGTEAVRRYQIEATTSASADLLLADCASSSAKPYASAQLLDAKTRVSLSGELLRSLDVYGSDRDPQAIPANQMEVSIVLDIPDASSGTLVLADGRRWSATRSEATEGGTMLTYLVPFSDTPQPVGWELPHAGELPELLSLTLPAPTSRAALLQSVLDVRAGQPTVAFRDGAPEVALTLTLTLAADAPALTLLPNDLQALADGAATTPRWTPPRLEAGTPQDVTVRVPWADRGALEIALAAWRVRLAPE